jgi:hypothetical protein
MKVVLDSRQGDVHDRNVHYQDELDQAEHGQRTPAPRIRCGDMGWAHLCLLSGSHV